MALNGGYNSRDPRINPNDPRLRQTMEDDVRKRHASRSPDDAAKPMQKLAKPNSNISNNGERKSTFGGGAPPPTAPMAAAASPAGSRRASVQSVPSSFNGINHTNGGPSADGGISANESTAVPASVTSGPASFSDLMIAFNRISNESAAARITLQSLEPTVKKCHGQYATMQPHFAQFPALKDTMTNEKNYLDRQVRLQQEKLARLESEQQEVLRALSGNSVFQGNPPPALPPAPQADEKREQANRDNQMKQLGSNAARAISKADKLDEKINAQDTKITAQDTKITDIETKISTFDDKVNAFSTRMTAYENKINETDTKIETVEKAVQDLQADQVDGQTIMEQHIDSKLEEHNSTIQNASKDLSDWVSNEISGLQKTVVANAIQAQNIAAIDNCLAQVATLREQVGQAASHTELAEAQGTLSKLSDEVGKLHSQPPVAAESSDNPLGLPQFQPLLPPGDEPIEAELPRVDRMEQEILALQNITQLHTQQFSNTTTDHVVQQMVDQMSVMYPAAKDFQSAVNQIKAQINELDGALTDLKLKSEMHDDAVSKGEKGFQSLQSDIKAVNQKIAELRGRVDQAFTHQSGGNGS